MESVRLAEELERQTTQTKHVNVNRYSKDSGVVDIELLKPLDLVTACTATTTQHQSITEHQSIVPGSQQHGAPSLLVVNGDGQSHVIHHDANADAALFSEHVRYMLSPVRLSSVVCLSVVCNVRAPYSGGSNFRQYFYGIRYLGHPLTSTKNFTAIVRGEPLRRGS